jgi:NAD+ kinase
MNTSSDEIQYLIREHMIENQAIKVSNSMNRNTGTDNNATIISDPTKFIEEDTSTLNNRIVKSNEKLHVRWNSQRGRIFIDGSHLTHDLELGDEILIDNEAPTLKMFSLRPDGQ